MRASNGTTGTAGDVATGNAAEDAAGLAVAEREADDNLAGMTGSLFVQCRSHSAHATGTGERAA
ncbi:hypothetical protein DRB87_10740 [Pandoraea sp. XY-2]|nr:hypothetical protein DRB87_10740 [Pandoraea sp. XY-2]